MVLWSGDPLDVMSRAERAWIDGREIYVGVLGNDRRRVLPIWELQFGDLAQGTRPIATEKVSQAAVVAAEASVGTNESNVRRLAELLASTHLALEPRRTPSAPDRTPDSAGRLAAPPRQ